MLSGGLMLNVRALVALVVPLTVAACGDNLGGPDEGGAIVVAPTRSLETTEAGGTTSFTIVLASEPTAEVTIPLSTDDATEGTVAPAALTFTPQSWAAPQTVTVTGADDPLIDGAQQFRIVTGPAQSQDDRFAGTDPSDVEVENRDDDRAGVVVAAATGMTTTEGGGQATFTIALAAQPAADVTIGLASDDDGEGTVTPDRVVFTADSWSAPRTVTIIGVDDAIADGAQTYHVVTGAAASSDAAWDAVEVSDVELTNTDDETAGITVTPTLGLTTTEGGGQATFVVVLDSEPTADVTIAVASDVPDEGAVTPASLTFTAADWDAPHVVTIRGVDDPIADGGQSYTIVTAPAASADPRYAALDAADVAVRNTDDDAAGITVAPSTGLVTTEGGGQASFTIVLDSQPAGDVTIAVASGDFTEGTVSPASVTFTPADWDAPRPVTITGANDAVADGDQPYTILTAAAVSTDPAYSGLDAANPSVSNTDDDSPGITVTPVAGLTTTEGGGAAAFTIVLNSQPATNVTIMLSSSDGGEGTAAPTSVTFTPANWDASQTVTVTGADDLVPDGDQPYTIVTAPAVSTDPRYAGVDAADVAVTNVDNDSRITVEPLDVYVSEFADSDTFTIVLNAQPTADVTIGLSSADSGEGVVSPSSVTFTTGNWNVPQTVTVTGVNDALADGDQVYLIVTAPVVSADPAYHGLNPPDVVATTVDNDSPGVFVKGKRIQRTAESGQSSFFRVRLTTQPSANVTCTFASSDTGEGVVSPATLVFTPGSFATFQSVTIAGVDDAIVDGDQLFNIVSAPCTSSDPQYDGVDPRDLLGLNRDND